LFGNDQVAGVVKGSLGGINKPTEIRELVTGKVLRKGD